METTNFRCASCDKLLAKFTSEWEFDDSKQEERTYICDGMEQYLEIKCPRCKRVNKKKMVGKECVFGKERHGDVVVHMPKTQIGKGTVDAEALEALNKVSRNAGNI